MGKILTVSIAAYNMENYIGQALDSLVSPEIIDDLEIFVIDDGGSDRTLAIAQRYAERYPGSVFPVRKENGGYGSTVNYGIRHAAGKYFKLLDGDDRFERDNLVRLVKLLRKLEADCVVSPWITFYEKTGKQVTENRYSRLKDGLYDFTDERLRSLPLMMYAVVFRTRILQGMGKTITEHCFYTDDEYVIYPIPYVETVYVWKRPVYLYRAGREGQSMGIDGIKKHYREHERVLWNTVRVCEGMEDGVKKSAVEARVMTNIMAAFKYLCYFPLSAEKKRETDRFCRRLRRRCPELLRKTEEKYIFVRMYTGSRGMLYPLMRFLTVLYLHRLFEPVRCFRERLRGDARFVPPQRCPSKITNRRSA